MEDTLNVTYSEFVKDLQIDGPCSIRLDYDIELCFHNGYLRYCQEIDCQCHFNYQDEYPKSDDRIIGARVRIIGTCDFSNHYISYYGKNTIRESIDHVRKMYKIEQLLHDQTNGICNYGAYHYGVKIYFNDYFPKNDKYKLAYIEFTHDLIHERLTIIKYYTNIETSLNTYNGKHYWLGSINMPYEHNLIDDIFADKDIQLCFKPTKIAQPQMY